MVFLWVLALLTARSIRLRSDLGGAGRHPDLACRGGRDSLFAPSDEHVASPGVNDRDSLSLERLPDSPLLGFRGSLFWDSSFNLLGFMPRLAAAPLITTRFDGSRWWSSAVAAEPSR